MFWFYKEIIHVSEILKYFFFAFQKCLGASFSIGREKPALSLDMGLGHLYEMWFSLLVWLLQSWTWSQVFQVKPPGSFTCLLFALCWWRCIFTRISILKLQIFLNEEVSKWACYWKDQSVMDQFNQKIPSQT